MSNYTFLHPSLVSEDNLGLKPRQEVYLKGYKQQPEKQEVNISLSTYISPFDKSYDLVYDSLLFIPLMGWCTLIASILISFSRSERLTQSSRLQKSTEHEPDRSLKCSIPCAQCYYFSTNVYVHCSIHPSKALTVEAIGCSDYAQENKIAK